jgi:hypothetical protein
VKRNLLETLDSSSYATSQRTKKTHLNNAFPVSSSGEVSKLYNYGISVHVTVAISLSLIDLHILEWQWITVLFGGVG